MATNDFDDLSLLEIYTIEVDAQAAALSENLISLEHHQTDAATLEALMRASHSLKGAARLVGVRLAERLAHAMEDTFSKAQRAEVLVSAAHIDVLLRATDFLRQTGQLTAETLEPWSAAHDAQVDDLVGQLVRLDAAPRAGIAPAAPAPSPAVESPVVPRDKSLRLATDRLDALLGLSSEVVVSAAWVTEFTASMLRLKVLQNDLLRVVRRVRETDSRERTLAELDEAERLALRSSQTLTERLERFDVYDRQMSGLSRRLHQEVVAIRMRPLSDVVPVLRRTVRDLARTLDKEAELDVEGADTMVDRDVLERLESPLTHLLRNAMDHGIERSEERVQLGKPLQGRLYLSASHSKGTLALQLRDDGHGIQPDAIRGRVLQRNLVSPEVANTLTEEELYEFLFLPNFTTRSDVNEISGRGVGLDVVQRVVKELGGRVWITSQSGVGTAFHLELPITLSLVRTICADIGGEVYAFPLAKLGGVLRTSMDQIRQWEGKAHIHWGRFDIPIVWGYQLLAVPPTAAAHDSLDVVVLGAGQQYYGVLVQRLLGQHNLVVQPLDPRLGKVQSISAGAILDDGSPILILDTDDLVRSMERIVEGSQAVAVTQTVDTGVRRERVLVVDDSITVREVERKLLELHGYQVEVAFDGIEAWNMLRSENFDLVVTDVDMPRMDGFQLLTRIRQDPVLRTRPVIIVSYKDRDEDRLRGMELGADCYLTKGAFQDEGFIKAVNGLLKNAR